MAEADQNHNEIKKDIRDTKEEVKEAKEEIIEAKHELRQAKEEIKEVHAEMKRAERDRLAVAREVEREVAARIITVVSAALALAAGLFWQTAITDTIKVFIPISGAWQYELGIAAGFTVVAAVAIYLLSKSADGMKKV